MHYKIQSIQNTSIPKLPYFLERAKEEKRDLDSSEVAYSGGGCSHSAFLWVLGSPQIIFDQSLTLGLT